MAFKTITVPGHGEIDFPDSMSDDDIATAIRVNIIGGSATEPPPTPEKPSLFSRAVSAVKRVVSPEPKPALSDEEWAASIARKADEKAAARKPSLMEMSGTGLPIRPMRPAPDRPEGPVSAPAGTRYDINAAEQPKVSITSPYSGVGASYLGGRVDIQSAKRPEEPKTFQVPSREEFEKAVASRKDAWKRAWERDNAEARKAGFSVGKEYPTAEAAIRAYREAVGRPIPVVPASYEEYVDERQAAFDEALGAEAAALEVGRGYGAEQKRRKKARSEADDKYAVKARARGMTTPEYMKSIGLEPYKEPYQSPEQYAEERAGVPRGVGPVGKAMASAGDMWSEASGTTGWRLISNLLLGKSSERRAGERILETEAALKDAAKVRAAKAKLSAGEELSLEEKRTLDENKFFYQLGSAVDAIKENPGEVAEGLLVDLIENAPIYALTNIGSVGATKALTGVVKSANNAKRMADAIAKGQSAAKAEIRAQRTAELGAKAIKPSALKTIGIEVAADVPADVAVGMVLEKARGRDYNAADLVTDLAFSGIINVPIGAVRSMQAGGILTAREFRQVADAFGDIGALATEPAVAEILGRLKTLSADEVLIPEGLKVSATGRSKAVSPEEARAAGYGEDVAAGPEVGRQILGSTAGTDVKLRPGADLATLEEEIQTARFNVLRKRAAAGSEAESALLQRINDWAAAVHAENAARPEGQRVALPQQSEAGNLELFTKVLAGDESGVELVPLVDVPDDIFNEWGRIFNTRVRTGETEPRPGVMTGRPIEAAPVQSTAAAPEQPVDAATPETPAVRTPPAAAAPVGPAAPRPSVMEAVGALPPEAAAAVRRPLPTEPPASVEGLTPRGKTQEQLDAEAAAEAEMMNEVRRDVGRLKRRPITAYERQGGGPLTPDAIKILEEIDAGTDAADIPISRLSQAAEQNRIAEGSPLAIVTALRAKAGESGPKPNPAEAKPEIMPMRRPLRPGEVDEPLGTGAVEDAASALARRMPVVQPEEPVGDLARIGRMARRPLPQYQLAGEAGAARSELAAARKAWAEKDVESPYFKKWFGESKVVDADGKPLVVYHGSPETGIESFDPISGREVEGAVFFSDNEDVAYQYRLEREYGESVGEDPGDMVEAYLSIKNPMVVDVGRRAPYPDVHKLVKQAKAAGNDGLILTNIDDSVGGSGDYGTTYAVFSPTQIKSATGNRGTFDAADSRINYQLRGFASRARKTIEDKMPARAPVKDVRGMLSGISPEEMKWMGVDDYLAGKVRVDKEDLLRYMDENAVDVQEVMKGERQIPDDTKYRIVRKSTRDGYEYNIVDLDRGRPIESHETLAEAQAALEEYKSGTTTVKDTKFDQWTTPGGSNYRELLLTMGSRQERDYSWEWFDPKTQTSKKGFASEKAARAEAPQGAIFNRIQTAERNPDYHVPPAHAYGDEASDVNRLAHVRFNDRTTADGRRVLFLEEVQSDWHQEGRKKGYATEISSDPDVKRLRVLQRENSLGNFENEKEFHSLWDSVYEKYGIPDSKSLDDVLREAAAGVPDAPFKKTWHELTLRRMLQYAAENGYDELAWLPGKEQAKRYDLSKQVERIEYADNGNGRYHVGAFGLDGRIAINETMDIDKLEATLGKDVAQKIVNGDGVEEGAKQSGHKVLSGVDLQVGGEGMAGFYDRIVPQYLNKYGKKWGARVGEIKVFGSDRPGASGYEIRRPNGESYAGPFDTEAEARPYLENPSDVIVRVGDLTVPSIPITDAMRGSITTAPQPLFQLRGSRPLTPVTEQARQRAADVARTVLASDKPMSAQTAAAKAGLKGKMAEEAAKRAIPIIKAVRSGKSYDEALAQDVLKRIMQKPSETIKQTILRTTEGKITGTEIVSAKAALESVIRQMQLKAGISAQKEAMREATRIRRLIVAASKKALDPELQGQMLAAVRDARTPADLSAAMARITTILSREQLKETVTRLEGLLKIDANKMEPKFRDAFKAIADDIDAGRGDAAARKYREWYEAQDDKPEIPKRFVKAMERIQGERLPSRGDIRSMEPERLAEEQAKWSSIADALATIAAAAEDARELRFGKDALKLDLTIKRGLKEVAESNPDEIPSGKKPNIIKRAIRYGSSPEYLIMLAGGRDGILHNVLFKRPAASMSNAYMSREEMRNIMKDFFVSQGKSEQDLIRWRNEKFTVKTDAGQTLTLTRPEAVSFYATLANDESRRLIENNKIQKWEDRGTKRDYKLSDADITRIKSQMTDFDVKTAETMLAIFDHYKSKLNEASVILDGYEKFTVENYFPRMASQDYLDKNLTNLREFWNAAMLEDGAFTMGREAHGNPLIIADAMNVFDRHIHDVAMYANMAVPLRNAARLIGNSDVSAEIAKRLGGGLEKQIQDFLFDASGMNGRAMMDDASKFYRMMLRSLSVGILGYRPTTIINNLFGAAVQIYAEIPEKYRADFIKNWATMTPAEERAIFNEMKAMDAYFDHRHSRDPYRLATWGNTEMPETVASSEAYIQFKKMQDHSMKWMQNAERRSAVAAYKAIRDRTSRAEAVGELNKRFRDASDASDPVKEYAAHETMVLTRRTQNAIDALDKSAFSRKMSENPLAMSSFMFTSQVYKLRDMLLMATLDYRRGNISKAEYARKVALIMTSAAAIPTFATLVWREIKEGGKERKESEEQKRMGAGLMMLLNSVEVADPMVGSVVRAIVDATRGGQGGGQRGQPVVQAVDKLARNLTKALNKKDEEAFDAFIAALGAGASIGGVPSAPFEALGAAVKFFRPDDPLIPYYNKKFKIEEKFGIHEPTGRKRTLAQALQAGVKLTPEEIREYKTASSIIEQGLKMRRLANEGHITDDQAEKIIEQRTKKP